MRIHGSNKPDPNGQLTFIGFPMEVQEGDLLQAAGEEYAVRSQPRAGNNFGKPGTELVLSDVGAYDFEVPRGGEPEALARITLDNRLQVRFKRTVLTDYVNFGEEDELFFELAECPDSEDEHGTDPDDPHFGHCDYNIEWRGSCREAPKGLLVGINLEPAGKPVKPSCRIVDTVYPTGAVVFSDGSSFQSHPDKEWIGWRSEADMRAV